MLSKGLMSYQSLFDLINKKVFQKNLFLQITSLDKICVISAILSHSLLFIFINMVNLLESMTEEYLCPIMKTPIQDPVITQDGHTYERKSIQNWFKTSQKSPITGLKLKSKNLIPNLALKNLKLKIQESLPQLLENFNVMKKENQQLQDKIQQLNEELIYEKEYNVLNESESKLYLKMLKMEQKRANNKQDYLKKQHIKIKNLQSRIREMKTKASSLKKEHQNQRELQEKRINELILDLEVKQRQHKNQLKDLSLNLQKELEKLYQTSNITTTILHITLRYFYRKAEYGNSQIKYYLSVLQDELKAYQTQTYTHYKMHRFICSNYQSWVPEINKIYTLTSKLLCRAQFKYFEVFNQMPIQIIIQIQENYKKNNSRFIGSQQFRYYVTGILVDNRIKNVDDQEWKKFMEIKHWYPNIGSLVIVNTQMTRLSKDDLTRFFKLKYLEISETKLNEESLRQIQLFNVIYPNVIVMQKPIQVQNTNANL